VQVYYGDVVKINAIQQSIDQKWHGLPLKYCFLLHEPDENLTFIANIINPSSMIGTKNLGVHCKLFDSICCPSSECAIRM